MAKPTVIFHVSLTIHEGKLDAFEGIAQNMIAGTLKEPGCLGYDWYLSPDHKQCRIIENYADENAVMAHLSGKVVQELVPKLFEVSGLNGFEVYGYPGEKAAAKLTGLGGGVFQLWRGLNR